MLIALYNFIWSCFMFSYVQACEEELTKNGIPVTWYQSSPANNVISDPLCYNEDNLITRNCINNNWEPSLSNLKPCLQAVTHYDLLSCPPNFDRISEKHDEYCYQVSDVSHWNDPCITSGGAPLITDLPEDDLSSLLDSLWRKNVSRFFWLPARRRQIFGMLRWTIPGPKWQWQVKANNSLRLQSSFLTNCLLLNLEKKVITTEACSKAYPSLCFYINDMHYPAKCPENYHAFRFMPIDGICYGIEQSEENLTFDEFRLEKCPNPVDEGKNNDLTRFIFKKIAKLNGIPDNVWCWFTRSLVSFDIDETSQNSTINNNSSYAQSQVTINKDGTLRLVSSNRNTTLSCMVCERKVIYGKTELLFEYSDEEQLMYLTVYFPSGLWKYNSYDRGVQCFSNAQGFVNVVDVNEVPFFEIRSIDTDVEAVEKIVYIIKLVTDRSAQYWCEGHTKEFSLITTEKIVVNPQGTKVHVFSLVINRYTERNDIDDLDTFLKDFSNNITVIFNAQESLVMDILKYNMKNLMVLFHLHVEIADIYGDVSSNIVSMYENLKSIAKNDIIKYNYTFVNISSSLCCLPATSIDNLVTLNWEMTSIGYIAAPTQFCLQANGLPVKRFCSGSYLLGSIWGDIEGSCNNNYVASNTTTFLYKFVKGQVPKNDISSFLIEGLSFVLSDVNDIIPADIYYLSISLKRVLYIVHNNDTLVKMGDIDNMAWVMDRVLSLDYAYLRLAQTLNSTNVILDSVNDIIEILSYKKATVSRSSKNYHGKESEVLAIQPQCIIYICYPHQNNVSGIAVINKNFANNFTEMMVRPLYRNTTLDDVLSIKNLEVAAWVPDNVLNGLKRKGNHSNDDVLDNQKLYIIISVFHSDAIFQELDNNKHKVNSRIIGISIPNFILNLKNYISLVFKNLQHSDVEKFCGYWDFKTRKTKNMSGSWSARGCFLKRFIDNITVCECYHLTHFGHLLNVGNSNKGDMDEFHARALNIITLIGSFLSLIGITCIWLTAFIFQTWRKKAGTKVLLHLSASIAFPLIFLIVFNLDTSIFVEKNGLYGIHDDMEAVCIALGALLHYSILASFTWMLLTAILQFIRYVRVLGVRRPSRFMLKLTVIGWGIPIIPVMAVLHVNKFNYIPDPTTCYKCHICYPKGLLLILCAVAPICIVLLINIILFAFVLWSVSKGPDGKMRTTDLDLIGAQLRLCMFLFFLLGLTWIFGIISFSKNLVWSYFFCLTSSLQGFVLFVYFILCDPTTRGLWVTLMKPQYRSNTPRESITSISSG